MADISDYEDAVVRIVNSDVDPQSVTATDVRRDLRGADAPQVTPKVAGNLADAVVTVDTVIGAIESSGELPTEAEVPAVASAADPYGMDDRAARVGQSAADQVATVEDVRTEVEVARETAESQGRPMFREDVEDAVSRVERGQRFAGASPGEVTDTEARREGAPARSSFERAAAQTVATGDQVSPAEVVEGSTRTTPVTVIRDTSGEAVAVTGGSTPEDREAVSREVGAPYMSADEVTESMDVEGSGDRADLTLRGRTVGRVDL